MTPVRVLLVDDDDLMRAGLTAVLSSDETIDVVGEAPDGRAAVDRAIELRPDVVLMDVRMPGLDGIAATRELLAISPDVRVVVLTTFEQDDYIFGALSAGASGFLLKRTRPEELIAAIHTVAAGDSLLSPSVTRTVIQRVAGSPRRMPRPRQAGRAHRTRARRSRVDRPWALERRDRRDTRDRGVDGQDARQAHPPEAPAPRPRASRDLRLRERPDPALDGGYRSRHDSARFPSCHPVWGLGSQPVDLYDWPIFLHGSARSWRSEPPTAARGARAQLL